MLHDRLEVYTLSIVFVGEFNPPLIQPFWLAMKDIIRESEAKNAKIEVIHNDVVKFELEWVKFEITKQRFELRSSQEPFFEAVRDLGVSIFNVLKETPITALGINHLKNFTLRNEETYYEFGNKVAPLSNWNNFLTDPRLLLLEIIELKRSDKLNGNYRIKVTGSDISLGLQFGVAININDHYIVPDESKGRNGEIVKLLASEWENSKKRCVDNIEAFWQNLKLD